MPLPGAPKILMRYPVKIVLGGTTLSEMRTNAILMSFCRFLIGRTGNGDLSH